MTRLPRAPLLLLIVFGAVLFSVAAQPSGPLRDRVSERALRRQRINDTGNAEHTIEVGGRRRSYLLHLPKAHDGKTALPLVVVFHGGGGNAQSAVRMSRMDATADRETFLVAYPNGTGPYEGALLTWNAWNCCGPALDDKVDDVSFVRRLVEALQKDHKVDAKRIYATGLSNGGMMTHRVGCELSDIFAGIAPVAGALNTDDCRPEHPVSVAIVHGTEDKNVRFEGGRPLRTADPQHPRVDRPVSYAVEFWVKHNRCKPEPVRARQGRVRQEVYAECAGGAAVELHAVEGGGHAWPGGRKGRLTADEPATELSASDLMWGFFERHPKK